MHNWADIRYGSIYQALERMARDGLVEQTGTSQEGRRPVRTTYRITKAGRQELRRLSRQAWSTPSQYVQPINVALSFAPLNVLPRDEVIECLEERLRSLELSARHLLEEDRKAKQRSDGQPGYQACVADHFEHFHQLLEVERNWTAKVLEHVRSGAYELEAEATSPQGPRRSANNDKRAAKGAANAS